MSKEEALLKLACAMLESESGDTSYGPVYITPEGSETHKAFSYGRENERTVPHANKLLRTRQEEIAYQADLIWKAIQTKL